jgi:hypothetical protein
MQKIKTLVSTLLMVIGLSFLASILIAYPVKWLWNWTVPAVFTGVNEISALQAWSLVFLLNLMLPNRNRAEKRSE